VTWHLGQGPRASSARASCRRPAPVTADPRRPRARRVGSPARSAGSAPAGAGSSRRLRRHPLAARGPRSRPSSSRENRPRGSGIRARSASAPSRSSPATASRAAIDNTRPRSGRSYAAASSNARRAVGWRRASTSAAPGNRRGRESASGSARRKSRTIWQSLLRPALRCRGPGCEELAASLGRR
jgi:hypothetical protein